MPHVDGGRSCAPSADDRTTEIRALNDQFRQTLTGGLIVTTPGIRSLPTGVVLRVVELIRAFDAFGPDNDPYGEHDFGAITIGACKVYWKIDYYDKAMEAGSPDPAAPDVTQRVMTIMLSSEY